MNKKPNNDLIVKIWTENQHLTNKQKTDIYNEKEGTKFVPRTLQQRYSNHIKGLEEGIQENASDKMLEQVANARVKLRTERKVVNLERAIVNKGTRDLGLVDTIIKEVRETAGYTPKISSASKPKPTSMKIVEYVISDEHYTGAGDNVVMNAFDKIAWDLRTITVPHAVVELRLSFLGDNIEGVAAHKSQLAVAQMVKPTIEYGHQVVHHINLINAAAKKLFKHEEFETTVVFVPESNHGQIRPLNTQRSELPEEDMGYVIQDMIQHGIDDDIYMYDAVKGIVETDDTFYLHGHQGFAKGRNFDKIVATLGSNKDVIMGHFHHLESHQKGDRVFLLAPAAKSAKYDYEHQGGFITASAILRVIRDTETGLDKSFIQSWKLMKVGK